MRFRSSLIITTLLIGMLPTGSAYAEEILKGQISFNGSPVNGAYVSGDWIFSLSTGWSGPDELGIFSIPLRDGKWTLLIFPSGNESSVAAPGYFKVTKVGADIEVFDLFGSPVSRVGDRWQFSLLSPNYSGEVELDPSYGETRKNVTLVGLWPITTHPTNGIYQKYQDYSDSHSFTDSYGLYLQDVRSTSSYWRSLRPFIRLNSTNTSLAIGPLCSFTYPSTKCKKFLVLPPNLNFKLVSASGTVENNTLIWIYDTTTEFQTQLSTGSDSIFRLFLTDGIYIIEPQVVDFDGIRHRYEIEILDQTPVSIVDLTTGTDYSVSSQVFSLRYQDRVKTPDFTMATSFGNYSIRQLRQQPGSILFKVDPFLPKSYHIVYSLNGDETCKGRKYSADGKLLPISGCSLNKNSDGTYTLGNLKKGDKGALFLIDSHSTVGSATDFEALLESPEEIRLAEVNSQAEAAAKVELELRTREQVETQAKAKTSITCIKGKTKRSISGTNPKCPRGFKKAK